MADALELALMSANVYDARRDESNRIGTPAGFGWTRVDYIPDTPFAGFAAVGTAGFSVGVFRRGNGLKGAGSINFPATQSSKIRFHQRFQRLFM